MRTSTLPKTGLEWMTLIFSCLRSFLNWWIILVLIHFLNTLVFCMHVFLTFPCTFHADPQFLIKVLVRNEFILNVHTSYFEDMGYNLKRDGWLNNFTNEKNQVMREDGVPWRGAHEKYHEFFSIIFFLMDKDDIIMNWQCGVGLFFISLNFISLFFYISFFLVFIALHIHFFILTFLFFWCSRGSVIGCRFIQRHIVVLESVIDILKSLLLSMREPKQKHTSRQVAPQLGSIFAPPPGKMAKQDFDLLRA